MKRPAVLALGTTRLLIAISTLTIAGCGASPTQPSTGPIPATFTATAGAQVLVDASKDGGVWWFPQSGTFDPQATHQGKALADAIRARGFTVDELPRGAAITATLLANYRLIIRVGNCGSYSGSVYSTAEISAYEQQLSRNMTLMLFTDHMNGGCRTTDPLSLRFGGITWTGGTTGTVDVLAEHEITIGMAPLSYIAGATIASIGAPQSVEILGSLGATKQAVMGIITGHTAKIFFLGDSNGIEQVPQPFVNNLLTWAF